MNTVDQGLSTRSLLPSERHVTERPWNLPLAMCVLLGVVCAVYSPTIQTLITEWLDTNKRVYTHGPLVVVLALWLLLRVNKGHRIEQSGLRMPVLACTALLSLLWLIAYRAGIQIGHQVLLPLLLWLSLWAAFGDACARRSLAPLLILYSAIPIWDEGIEVLQHATVFIVATALKIVGVPAYVAGSFVEIPSGVFEIADGCAGLHYFVVAVTLAAIYGELQRDSIKVRVQLLLLAAGLAAFANWVRVFIVIVAGYLTNMQHYLVRVDHYYFGWILFGAAMIVFFRLGSRFPPSEATSSKLPSTEPQAPVASGGAWAVAAAVATMLGPAIGWSLPLEKADVPNLTLPESLAEWSVEEGCDLAWQPTYSTADMSMMRQYTDGDRALCVFSASYLIQHQAKELVSYDNRLIPHTSSVVSTITTGVSLGSAFAEIQWMDEAGALSLLWYTYAIGEDLTASSLQAQLRYGVQSLTGKSSASVLALRSGCAEDCTLARETMMRFFQEGIAPQFSSLRPIDPEGLE